MSGKNFMSYGDADTILTEFSNDIKSRVSTKANQGLTAQQQANAKANIDIDKVPNVATNDQTPTFLEESTRTNIASGDKLSLIFGKIKKFFSDLKAVAFSGSYNDLSDTPTLVECSTERNVAAKTVTLPGFKLKTGARISVRFTDTSSSNPTSGNITLNVNGTGAKEIVDGRTNMAKIIYSVNWFSGNQVNDFIYDGTYWVMTNRDNNTTYSSKAAASGGTATSLCTTGEKYTWNNKQNALTFDNVPTQNSNNPVKSGGIFSTMAVPKYDSANRREYYEGGAAFDGNIDSVPTAGSNNAVASGGTKTYVDNAVATKRSLTASSSVIGDAVNIANATSTSPYTTPHEGFVRVRGNASGETYLYICDKLALIVPNFNSLTSIWLPKGVPLYFDNQHYAPGLAQWFNCSND